MNFPTALLNVRQMAEADRLAVAAGVPARVLMENAGCAVAMEIQRRWTIRAVSVLCGPGNNGGDGFVVARILTEAGWPVVLALLGAPDRLTGEARHHAALWCGPIEPLTPAILDRAQLVVDALFGAGLSRILQGPAAAILSAVVERQLPIVAVDVPSGVLGDTGENWGAVPAFLTVTFFRKKPGHLLLPGRKLCGEVVVADIGIPPAVLEQIRPDTFENDPVLWQAQLPPGKAHRRLPSLMDRVPRCETSPQPDDQFTHPLDRRPADLEIGDTAGLETCGTKAPSGDVQAARPEVLSLNEAEFHRHFGGNSDVLGCLRSAAQCNAGIILYAGEDTVIVALDGRAVIQPGKVAGSITTIQRAGQELAGQGMEPFLAAAAAIWQGETNNRA